MIHVREKKKNYKLGRRSVGAWQAIELNRVLAKEMRCKERPAGMEIIHMDTWAGGTTCPNALRRVCAQHGRGLQEEHWLCLLSGGLRITEIMEDRQCCMVSHVLA